MKVLIIDDKAEVRETLRRTIKEQHAWQVEGRGFRDLQEELLTFRPDAIVLDLVEGDVTENVAGNESFREIRKSWFCPVVVWSDYQGLEDFRHTLVEAISKGTDSDIRVMQQLERFTAVAGAIRDVHRDFDRRVREALHDFTPLLSKQAGIAENMGNDPVLPRAVRRLVAARMDADVSGGGELKAWERFVVPPLGEHLLSADLLRQSGAGWDNPEAFRLVLTPTCDLVRHGGEEPKAEQVLVARCQAITTLGNVPVGAGTELKGKARVKVKSTLREGIADGLLPIPRFISLVPSMVADLRRLELVQGDDIRLKTVDGNATTLEPEFVRVASTDSPFRELVVWAYLRMTGRPGAPLFDVDGWVNDITAPRTERDNREGD